jgi:hypothetical protein
MGTSGEIRKTTNITSILPIIFRIHIIRARFYVKPTRVSCVPFISYGGLTYYPTNLKHK